MNYLKECCGSAGNALENPWTEPSEDMFTRSVSPETAPDNPTYIEIEFKKGDPYALNGDHLSPASMLSALNTLAGANGIGRIDIVESRFVGMKSRGVYETPGGTILLTARRAMESITLDREEMHLKVGSGIRTVNPSLFLTKKSMLSLWKALKLFMGLQLLRVQCVKSLISTTNTY